MIEVNKKKEKQENIVQDLLKDHKEVKNEYNKYKEIVSTLKKEISIKENKFRENTDKITKIIQELKDKKNDNEALIQTLKKKIELKNNQIKKEIEEKIKYKANFLILKEKFKSKKLQLQKLKE